METPRERQVREFLAGFAYTCETPGCESLGAVMPGEPGESAFCSLCSYPLTTINPEQRRQLERVVDLHDQGLSGLANYTLNQALGRIPASD